MNEKLTIKYEIKSFDELKLPIRIKNLVSSKLDNVYRFIFYSTPGTGKTTLAKILAKNKSILYLSGSNDFNVATMRNKVYPFCNQYSVDNKEKIVIIDECDNIPKKLQEAFKIILDSTKKSVRFIFITNNITKMDDAVMSRCTEVNFNYSGSELAEQQANYVSYAVNVCNKEGVKFDKEGMTELYKRHFPDFRAIIDKIEDFKLTNLPITGKTVKNSEIVDGKENVEIYDLIENPKNYTSKEFFLIISKYRGLEADVLMSLCEPFFRHLNNQEKFDKTLKVSEIVNKYCVDYDKTMNKFALLISCVYELRKIGI